MNIKLGFAFALAAWSLAGCSSPSADQATDQAAQVMKNGAQHVMNGASNATGGVANAAETSKVKAALLAAKGLDTTNLSVETVGNQVFLKGSVPTADQIAQAKQVATQTCGTDYQVVDQLTHP